MVVIIKYRIRFVVVSKINWSLEEQILKFNTSRECSVSSRCDVMLFKFALRFVEVTKSVDQH